MAMTAQVQAAADRPGSGRAQRALTLLEVMIALAMFFTAVFAILGLVSNTLANARALQRPPVDAGVLAAQLTLTNRLYEGHESGDFGDLYPGYTWEREIYEVSSNGLFRVDFVVRGPTRKGRGAESHLSILLFRPESPAGRASGGLGAGLR